MTNNSQDLKELIDNNSKIIIDFWSTWCAPCKKIAPFFNKLEQTYPSIKFVKINIEEVPFSIKCLPTFYFYHNSEKIAELNGANSEQLKKLTEDLANRL